MHFFIDIKDEVVRSKVKGVNNDNRQIRKCGKSAAKFVNMLKMVVNLNKAVESVILIISLTVIRKE